MENGKGKYEVRARGSECMEHEKYTDKNKEKRRNEMGWRQGDEGMGDCSEGGNITKGITKSTCAINKSEKIRHSFRVTEQTGK